MPNNKKKPKNTQSSAIPAPAPAPAPSVSAPSSASKQKTQNTQVNLNFDASKTFDALASATLLGDLSQVIVGLDCYEKNTKQKLPLKELNELISYAVSKGHDPLITFLMDQKGDQPLADICLALAIMQGCPERVTLLCSKPGANLNQPLISDHLPPPLLFALEFAVQSKQSGVFKVLLAAGAKLASLDRTTGMYLPVLHLAASYGNLETMRHILSINPKCLNVLARSGNSAIDTAVISQQREAFDELFGCRATFNYRNFFQEADAETTQRETRIFLDQVLGDLPGDQKVGFLNKFKTEGARREKRLSFLRTLPADLVDSEGNTLLHMEALVGNVAGIQKICLSHPHLVDMKNSRGDTPLDVAIIHKQEASIEALFSRIPKDQITDYFHKMLFYGVRTVAKTLFNQYPDLIGGYFFNIPEGQPESFSRFQQSVLAACLSGKEENVKDFCVIFPDKMATVKDPATGQTLLHLVMLGGNKTQEYLHEMDPDIAKIREEKKLEPIPDVMQKNRAQIVTTLCEIKGLLEKKDLRGQTPLHTAAQEGFHKIVLTLCQLNPTLVNEEDVEGQTPLHLAATAGHLDVVKVLCLQGQAFTDVKALNDATTPYERAYKNGHTAVADFLRNNAKTGKVSHPQTEMTAMIRGFNKELQESSATLLKEHFFTEEWKVVGDYIQLQETEKNSRIFSMFRQYLKETVPDIFEEVSDNKMICIAVAKLQAYTQKLVTSNDKGTAEGDDASSQLMKGLSAIAQIVNPSGLPVYFPMADISKQDYLHDKFQENDFRLKALLAIPLCKKLRSLRDHLWELSQGASPALVERIVAIQAELDEELATREAATTKELITNETTGNYLKKEKAFSDAYHSLKALKATGKDPEPVVQALPEPPPVLAAAPEKPKKKKPTVEPAKPTQAPAPAKAVQQPAVQAAPLSVGGAHESSISSSSYRKMQGPLNVGKAPPISAEIQDIISSLRNILAHGSMFANNLAIPHFACLLQLIHLFKEIDKTGALKIKSVKNAFVHGFSATFQDEDKDALQIPFKEAEFEALAAFIQTIILPSVTDKASFSFLRERIIATELFQKLFTYSPQEEIVEKDQANACVNTLYELKHFLFLLQLFVKLYEQSFAEDFLSQAKTAGTKAIMGTCFVDAVTLLAFGVGSCVQSLVKDGGIALLKQLEAEPGNKKLLTTMQQFRNDISHHKSSKENDYSEPTAVLTEEGHPLSLIFTRKNFDALITQIEGLIQQATAAPAALEQPVVVEQPHVVVTPQALSSGKSLNPAATPWVPSMSPST